jgi:hypothetical protein
MKSRNQQSSLVMLQSVQGEGTLVREATAPGVEKATVNITISSTGALEVSKK